MRKQLRYLLGILAVAVVTNQAVAECSSPAYLLINTASSTDDFPDSYDTSSDRIVFNGGRANKVQLTNTAASCTTPPCECGKEDISPYNTDANYPVSNASNTYFWHRAMVVGTGRNKTRLRDDIFVKNDRLNPGDRFTSIEKAQSTLAPCKLTVGGNDLYFFKVKACNRETAR